jgi:malate synthase
MEDLATLEISRVQVAQWLGHGVLLDDGSVVDEGLVQVVFDEELARILDEVPASDHAAFRAAAAEAREVFLEPEPRPFLSLESDLASALAAAEAA